MALETTRKILDKIKEYSRIIIFRHKRPDGDAVGSTMGLAEILRETFPEKEIYVQNCDYAKYLEFLGGEGEIIYIGKAEVGSVEKTYFFNVSPFVKSIEESDKLTLSVRIPSYAEEKESSLVLSDVGLYGSSGSGRSMIFTVVTVAISTLAICGLLFLLTRRRARNMSKNDD
jgi:hypothetical protein